MRGRKITTEEFVEECKKTFPDKDFSYEKTIYTGANNKVIITCPVHGDLEVYPRYFLKSKGCPYERDYEPLAFVNLGETKLTKWGETMTVIHIENMRDINVKFSKTGHIEEHTTARKFINDKIADPLYHEYKYLGMQNLANNGQLMWIKKLKGSTNADVEFEDGTVVTDVKISNFKNGEVANPNFLPANKTSVNEIILQYYFSKIGFQKAPCGSLKELGRLELDLYNPDINGFKVAIEYDGYQHKTKRDEKKNSLCRQNNIILFRVREPQAEQLKDHNSLNFIMNDAKAWSECLTPAIEFIVSKINEITGSDFFIDVNFERDRDEIKTALSKYHNRDRAERLGEVRVMNNGMEAKIIEYLDSAHIIVEFLCDKYRASTSYDRFVRGICKHPNFNTQTYNNAKKMIGTKLTDKDGVEHEIIGYNGCDDMTFKNLLTGEIIEHVDFHVFATKSVHPTDHTRRNKPVRATNVKTGEITIFKNAKECSEYLNGLCNTIYRAIREHEPYKGWLLEYVTPDESAAYPLL